MEKEYQNIINQFFKKNERKNRITLKDITLSYD